MRGAQACYALALQSHADISNVAAAGDAVNDHTLEAPCKKRACTAVPERLQEPAAELIAKIADVGADGTEGISVGRGDREAPGAGQTAGQADAALLPSLAQEPPERAAASSGIASQVHAHTHAGGTRDSCGVQLGVMLVPNVNFSILCALCVGHCVSSLISLIFFFSNKKADPLTNM